MDVIHGKPTKEKQVDCHTFFSRKKTGNYSYTLHIYMMRPTDNSPVSSRTPLHGGVYLLKKRLSLPQYHCNIRQNFAPRNLKKKNYVWRVSLI